MITITIQIGGDGLIAREDQSISQRLKALVIERDMTRMELAGALKCSRAMLGYLFAGKRKPSARFIARLDRLEKEAA